MNKKYLSIILGAIIVIIAFLFVRSMRASNAVLDVCPRLLTKEMLDEGLAKATDFILANQLPAGNFAYEYDWKSRTYTDDDLSVRQAGVLWGLATIYQYTHDEKLVPALEKGFSYFEQHSEVRADGGRYILYPDEAQGSLGTVALVTLAHIDYLRARTDIKAVDEKRHEQLLKGYLTFITTAVRKDKRFYGSYDAAGKSYGDPSPYYDGEALLALVKAVRYRGFDWKQNVQQIADAGYTFNVTEALKADPDSDITKGYYQWSSMAWRELAESGWADKEKYAGYALVTGDWIIDGHQILDRTRNTGYAYEGLLSAYALAQDIDDTKHANKFRCATEQGLGKLMTWQVGSTYANDYITRTPTNDPKALGGIQNAADESKLRIDVTQHQAHAMILALEALFSDR